MKLINPTIHGILDYVVVTFLWASALIFPFTVSIKLFTPALGCVHLVLTLITNFPGGVVKVLPLKIHAIIELAVSIILIVSPGALGLQGVDKIFYVAFGIAVFL